jgi:AcrR family transcriptional regulator
VEGSRALSAGEEVPDVDVVERLLVSVDHAGISTRRIAEQSNQPYGLVRYHFRTLEGLMLHRLDRVSERILERQRALCDGPADIRRRVAYCRGLHRDLVVVSRGRRSRDHSTTTRDDVIYPRTFLVAVT